MKCPVCNRENGPGVNFCEGCGRRIPRCPTCGLELTSRDRFCSNDGTRLSDDLLILVPEESILRGPVWSKPADDLTENTVSAVAPATPWNDMPEESTVRVTAVSGGNRIQGVPPVRNSDPADIPAWDNIDINVDAPQRAYCENCGKRIASGNRFCSECQRGRSTTAAKSSQKSGSKKGLLAALIIFLLLLAAGFGGYALVTSDLFDWDSSNRAEKTDDEDDEDEDEGEDGEDITDPDDGDTASGNVTEEPTGEVPGVEDPVDTTPTAEPTTEPTAPTTEETEPTTEPESDPLMYWIDNCDKMYLSKEDLAGFDAKMCVYARNACYAKSGRKFNSADLQQYFQQFDWYNPTVSPNQFSASMLNAYQTANINLILEYERAHGYNQ